MYINTQDIKLHINYFLEMQDYIEHSESTPYSKNEIKDILYRSALNYYHKLNDLLFGSNNDPLEDNAERKEILNCFDKLDELLSKIEP